ncbi:hypothetical protein V1499_11975 [Neobacillus sp. SCS-31]|uniref:hypothetical protein n=1 Tax=Neobacillus oceani TaxID=3115292 RepID=UPI003905F7F5
MESTTSAFINLTKGFKLPGISIAIAGLKPEITLHAVNAGIDIKGKRNVHELEPGNRLFKARQYNQVTGILLTFRTYCTYRGGAQ